MAGPRLFNAGSPVLEIFFDTWIGHPQKSRWQNDSITRLGSARASTQVTRKVSQIQTSMAQNHYYDYDDMDAAIDYFSDFTRKGRFSFEGFSVNASDSSDAYVIPNIIIKDITYTWTRGAYLLGPSQISLSQCFPLQVTWTITYIIDEEEEA